MSTDTDSKVSKDLNRYWGIFAMGMSGNQLMLSNYCHIVPQKTIDQSKNPETYNPCVEMKNDIEANLNVLYKNKFIWRLRTIFDYGTTDPKTVRSDGKMHTYAVDLDIYYKNSKIVSKTVTVEGVHYNSHFVSDTNFLQEVQTSLMSCDDVDPIGLQFFMIKQVRETGTSDIDLTKLNFSILLPNSS